MRHLWAGRNKKIRTSIASKTESRSMPLRMGAGPMLSRGITLERQAPAQFMGSLRDILKYYHFSIALAALASAGVARAAPPIPIVIVTGSNQPFATSSIIFGVNGIAGGNGTAVDGNGSTGNPGGIALSAEDTGSTSWSVTTIFADVHGGNGGDGGYGANGASLVGGDGSAGGAGSYGGVGIQAGGKTTLHINASGVSGGNGGTGGIGGAGGTGVGAGGTGGTGGAGGAGGAGMTLSGAANLVSTSRISGGNGGPGGQGGGYSPPVTPLPIPGLDPGPGGNGGFGGTGANGITGSGPATILNQSQIVGGNGGMGGAGNPSPRQFVGGAGGNGGNGGTGILLSSGSLLINRGSISGGYGGNGGTGGAGGGKKRVQSGFAGLATGAIGPCVRHVATHDLAGCSAWEVI